MPLASLALVGLASLPLAQDTAPPQWLLVRSTTPWQAPLSWERLEGAYLRRFRSLSVEADQAQLHRSANRLVIGRPEDNALVDELAPELGLEWKEDALAFQHQAYGPGQGLVIVLDDPDGGGLLALYTGFDQAGVLAGLSTTTDITRRGFTVVEGGRKLEHGAVHTPRSVREPVIVRLDRDFERLMEETRGWPGPARNLRVGRGLAGYAHVYHQYGGQRDLLPTIADVLVPGTADIEVARRFFARRDLDAELAAAFALCTRHLGPLAGPGPVYYVLYHQPHATNAQNFGADGFTGRRQILFNLTALAKARHWNSAIVHETVHAWQQDFGRTLAERAVADGIATTLTGVFLPELSDADVLLWDPEDLAAADARRDEILVAFRAAADSTNRDAHGEFMLLDVPLSSVEGAPARTGYYVAWLACKAWLARNPDQPPRTLIDLPVAEILAALD